MNFELLRSSFKILLSKSWYSEVLGDNVGCRTMYSKIVEANIQVSCVLNQLKQNLGETSASVIL
jgi:hypothetical protein